MPDYVLPCTCGQHLVVSTAQAGDSVRCGCGNEIQVPTMRDLRGLERAAASGHGGESTWDDRHRIAFLLALGALTCLGVAVYLWATLPAHAVQPTDQELSTAIDAARPAELFLVHADLLGSQFGDSRGSDAVLKTRQMMSWGIAIVLALAAAAVACAVMVLLSRSSSRRPSPGP